MVQLIYDSFRLYIMISSLKSSFGYVNIFRLSVYNIVYGPVESLELLPLLGLDIRNVRCGIVKICSRFLTNVVKVSIMPVI